MQSVHTCTYELIRYCIKCTFGTPSVGAWMGAQCRVQSNDKCHGDFKPCSGHAADRARRASHCQHHGNPSRTQQHCLGGHQEDRKRPLTGRISPLWRLLESRQRIVSTSLSLLGPCTEYEEQASRNDGVHHLSACHPLHGPFTRACLL